MTPTQAPSTGPTFAWTNGKLFRSYDFKGIGGVFYQQAGNQIFVVDAINDDVTPRRYLVREFNADGTFIGAFSLAPNGMKDPDHVDSMAFDLRGLPFYVYRADYDYSQFSGTNTPQFWGVYELITATVVQPTSLPFHTSARGGVSAIASQGDTFTLGYIALDPDKTVNTRKLSYSRAEEDQQPQAIFSYDDPLSPTTAMAASQAGVLYYAGPLPNSAGFAIKSVDQNQKQSDFKTLDALPSNMWCDPDGDLYVSFDKTSSPALVRKYKADGTLLGETEAKFDDGSFLTHIAGLTFDGQGRRIVTGTGLDANTRAISGLYTFTE